MTGWRSWIHSYNHHRHRSAIGAQLIGRLNNLPGRDTLAGDGVNCVSILNNDFSDFFMRAASCRCRG